MADWRGRGSTGVISNFEHRSEDPSLTSDTSTAEWISNLAATPERGLVGDTKFMAPAARTARPL